MLKKSTLLCSCGSLHFLHPHPSVSPHPPIPNTRNLQAPAYQSRRFAHVHSSHSIYPEEDLSWPNNSTFSPYDIFKQERTAPYSNRRFYQLVKVYHPDRPCNGHPLCKNIPESVRLHRYRLLVAAHELLSDPKKREAYDKHGDGWLHRPELFARPKEDSIVYRYSMRRAQDADIFRNATWEDWEQWHDRNNGRQKQSSPASHSTFASLFLLLALFGGSVQAVSIGKYAGVVENRVQEVDKQCAKVLDERRYHTKLEMESKNQRVQSFLKKRDPSGSGLKGDEEETYRSVLGPDCKAAVKADNTD